MTKVSRSKHIIAIGGGGFGNDPALDRYILSRANMRNPAICLVPTASGDATGHIENFYTVRAALPCIPTHLSLMSSHATMRAYRVEKAGGIALETPLSPEPTR